MNLKNILSMFSLMAVCAVDAQNIQIDLKVFLEGPFLTSEMTPFLNEFGSLPYGQPYHIPPWNYEGTEVVTTIPNLNVIDWVLLELRQSVGPAETAGESSILARKAVFLLRDGSITALDGASLPQFNVTVSGNLYAVIWHRNHLGIMSASPLTLSNGVYVYDFTDDANKVFGAALGHKEVAPGIWAMIGGDGSPDGQIGNTDKNDVWKMQAGQSGYLPGDFDMNGQVDNADKIEIWSNNTGNGSQVPPAGQNIWSCGTPIVDLRDGQTYNTVMIGDQCWFAQNLNLGIMVSGPNPNQTNNGIYEKFCYGHNPYFCEVYGGLYKYSEVLDYNITEGARGMCPGGWHIPTNEEYKKLEGFADSQYPYPDPEWNIVDQYRGFDAGLHLKSDVLWNGNDTYKFGMLPAGGWNSLFGMFEHLYSFGHLWTSTPNPYQETYIRTFNSSGKIRNGSNWESNGFAFSARCIKDVPFNEPPEAPHDPLPPNGATDIPVNTPLQWSCSDPDGGTLSYSLYLGTVSNPGLFATNVQDTVFNAVLNHETIYYWRVVAYDNQGGSTSGPVWSFQTEELVCPNQITDPRDGQVYSVVQVENRCWMAENLNYGNMIPGTQQAADNGIPEKYCYGDDPANCDVYGALYPWDELMQYGLMSGIKGLCPDGWYIPTDEDLKMLEGAADSQYGYPDPVWNTTGWRGADAGANLKATTGWNSGGNGTDILGFTVRPSGNRGTTGTFNGIGQFANFWTSDTTSASKTWIHGFSYVNPAVYRGELSRLFGVGVRCIQGNAVNQPPLTPSAPQPPDGSTGIGIDANLHWYCKDPDGDILSYDVFFSEANPPALVAAGVPDTLFNPGPLEYNKTYYWKIVAHDNHNNSAEGPVWIFSTPPSWQCGLNWIDTRDGQVYSTVMIGDRCWMASNMNIGAMINGNVAMSNNGVLEKYCFNNNTANCDTYGGLYQWNEAMQYSVDTVGQGICPPGGWHIPTDYEWKVLEGTVDSQFPVGSPVWNDEGFRGFDAGGNMKEEGTAHWNSPNTGATNSSGFTALPGGYKISVTFDGKGEYGYFWTSIPKQAVTSWVRMLYNESKQIYRYGMDKYSSFSVRCLKNPPNQPPAVPFDPQPANGALEQPTNLILHWSCYDPEDDPITYDVFFGTTNPPGQVATGQSDTLYNPGVLTCNTNYFWKIVAHDNQGNTTEGVVWSFKTIEQPPFLCGDTLTDSRDGRKYPTVQIGNQCWMAKNLDYGTMVPMMTYQQNNGIPEKSCYSNNIVNCEIYGGLYQWEELLNYNLVAGSQGLCPSDGGGWHVATNGEWQTLVNFLGGASVAGGKLKEAGLEHWLPPNTGATNSSGFTALPGGMDGQGLGQKTMIWTSTESWYDGILGRYMSYTSASVTVSSFLPDYEKYSARCIRDYPNQPPNQPVCIQPPDGGFVSSFYVILVWSCTDPENDPLLFDVYFAPIGSPLELFVENFDPVVYPYPEVNVYQGNSYNWKIVAKDDHNNVTEGPVWTFHVN